MEMAFISRKRGKNCTKGAKGTSSSRQHHRHDDNQHNLVPVSTIPQFSIPTLSSSCATELSSLLIRHHDNKAKDFVEATRRARRSSSAVLWWWACVLLSSAILLSSSNCGQAEAKHAWERPGCHKVGHTRKVSIPECVEFTITTNACRGYCESFAVPSAWSRMLINPLQAITSVGQCCNIMETEDVIASVMCLGGERELTFKSAKSCDCYHCKKD